MEAIIDYRGKTPEKKSFGIPLITAKIVKDGRIETPEEFICPDEYDSWMRRGLPRAGDVVLTTEAPLGEVAQLDGTKVALAQRIITLRGRSGVVDNGFLRFAMRSDYVQNQLRARASGTTVLGIKQSELRRVTLLLPPVSEQRAIARILGALDKKIELNRKMNATLEAMARALFKSWFVDFDPVRARAEGRAPSGMDTATATLFPCEFVESKSKPIPRGWRYGSVGEFVELQRGTTYKSALKDFPGPVLLGLGAIQRNGGFRDDKLSTYGGDSPEKLLVRPGEIFASLKDVTQSADLLGAIARVPRHVAVGRLTQDTVKLLLTGSIDIGEVLYRTLLTDEYREHCRQHATGTTNLGLSREDFLSYPIVVASVPVLDAFNTSIRSLASRAESAVIESRTLARIRDELLPRLLSGELPVDAVQCAVEEVA